MMKKVQIRNRNWSSSLGIGLKFGCFNNTRMSLNFSVTFSISGRFSWLVETLILLVDLSLLPLKIKFSNVGKSQTSNFFERPCFTLELFVFLAHHRQQHHIDSKCQSKMFVSSGNLTEQLIEVTVVQGIPEILFINFGEQCCETY